MYACYPNALGLSSAVIVIMIVIKIMTMVNIYWRLTRSIHKNWFLKTYSAAQSIFWNSDDWFTGKGFKCFHRNIQFLVLNIFNIHHCIRDSLKHTNFFFQNILGLLCQCLNIYFLALTEWLTNASYIFSISYLGLKIIFETYSLYHVQIIYLLSLNSKLTILYSALWHAFLLPKLPITVC